MIERYQTEELKPIFKEESRFEYMLTVEKAVAQVQASLKIIPQAAAKDITQKSRINVKEIQKIEAVTKHDVIAFVSQVAKTVGKNGKYIHYGLTSSDVLDTALSLQISEALQIVIHDFKKLTKTLLDLAQKHKSTLCAGRTHGMHAELTTFGFKLMGHLAEFKRVEIKLHEAHEQIRICKLSGAVGTSSSIPLEIEEGVAQKLKLRIEPFATQVIPRDRHAGVFSALAFLALALERLSVELRHLQRTEVSEVVEGFSKGQKGSSAMPHKKNPISAENITGLARLIKGHASVAMENVVLWHERDISHSSNERVIIPDTFFASHYIVKRMNSLLEGLYVNEERMKINAYQNGGILFSSHLLLHLIENHNMSREEAYEVIQKASHELLPGQNLKDILMQNPETKKLFTETELNQVFSGKEHLGAIAKRFEKFKKELLHD